MGFYNGVASPAIAQIPTNSVVFGSFELAKRQLGVKSESDFTLKQNLMAGCFASIVNTPVVCSTDLVKCRMQAEEAGTYRNTLDCLFKICKAEGVLALFNG